MAEPSAPWKDFDPKAAAKGAGYRMQTRIPIIGTSGRLPVSSTKTDELFKYQRAIDDMGARYAKWDKDSSIDPTKGRGTSAEGRARIGHFVGPQPPAESWSQGKIPVEGIVPKSNNPVYDMFMKQMFATYSADSPDKGGIGFKSLWKNHDIYKKKLEAMDATHAGTEALYVDKMKNKMPKTRMYLEKNGIDPYDYRAVRDFYANRVVKLSNVPTIQATEQKFNKTRGLESCSSPDRSSSYRCLILTSPGLITSLCVSHKFCRARQMKSPAYLNSVLYPPGAVHPSSRNFFLGLILEYRNRPSGYQRPFDQDVVHLLMPVAEA